MLTDADHELSNRISPRTGAERRGEADRPDTRALFVKRLRPAPKAIARLGLRSDLAEADPLDYSLYCEPCQRWWIHQDWGDEFTCPGCGTVYVAETIIFSAVESHPLQP